MTPETAKLVRELIVEIHQNAASGLLDRRIIILATKVEQALGRDERAAPAPAGRVDRETR